MATLKWTNLDREGQTDLRVGDRWAVEINGATPGEPVFCQSSFNSGPLSYAQYGYVDPEGNYSRIGTAGVDDIGLWSETWWITAVGEGGTACNPTIQFRVKAASDLSEEPVELPDPLWFWGFKEYQIPEEVFVSDDIGDGKFARGYPSSLLGGVALSALACPWNASSAKVGSDIDVGSGKRVLAF